MSISGPQALAALDEALRDLRREEDDILRKLMRGLERLAKLRDTETELLRQLAGLQLAADPAAALAGAVARTTSTLRAVLETRGREMAAAGQRRRQIETALATAKPLPGEVYGLERDRNSRHGAIMKYNLNEATG